MKILLATIPLREHLTGYPPFAILALVQSLRKAGYDPYFYDIDALRPSFDEAVAFISSQKPDLIGISAVVSTAYEYTKKLCLALKKAFPDLPVVVGGNLAASSELLLRRCKVDICAIGEGERTIVQLARFFEKNPKMPSNKDGLRLIKGLTFLDESGHMEFTGYDTPIPAEEFLEPDYSILEQFSNIDLYVQDPHLYEEFEQDPRTHQSHRRGKKSLTIYSSKGCVARCTFCHRWRKGYAMLEAKNTIKQMKYLMDTYNVGFFRFTEENFGSDRKKLEEFLRLVKPLDILYQIGGVRVRSVNPDILKKLKDSGCVALYYGMETGSPTILKVMEKNATLEMNLQAARWTHEAGLYTCYQMVLAMPGENKKTIGETTEFLKQATEFLSEPPQRKLSLNYIQALPGTPVYEYARIRGLIGSTMDDEEDYLMKISDTDACDDSKFINFTEEDYFTVQSWRRKILFDVQTHYYKKRNWKVSQNHQSKICLNVKNGYFNLSKVIHNPIFYRYFQWLRTPYLVLSVLKRNLTTKSQEEFWKYSWDWVKARFIKNDSLREAKSLRRIVKESARPPQSKSEENMRPLRLG